MIYNVPDSGYTISPKVNIDISNGEAIKPGTERNGTDPEVIVTQYGRGHRICYGKLVLIGSSMYRELISRPVPAPRRRDKHSAASLEPH